MSDDAAREPFTGISFHQKNHQSNPVNEIKIKIKSKRKQIETTRRNLYRIEANRAWENQIESPRREELPVMASCAVGDERY
jgi:hypothetical protein